MSTHDADMRRSEPMGLTGLDHVKMALVIEEGWRDLDPESRERVMAAADARSGLYHQWIDHGDGTLSVSWSGVELARVEMFRVMRSPVAT